MSDARNKLDEKRRKSSVPDDKELDILARRLSDARRAERRIRDCISRDRQALRRLKDEEKKLKDEDKALRSSLKRTKETCKHAHFYFFIYKKFSDHLTIFKTTG